MNISAVLKVQCHDTRKLSIFVAMVDLYNCVCYSVESTALRLIMGLGSWEVQPQLSRVFTEPKSESEELNRALVLTLARALHVTG